MNQAVSNLGVALMKSLAHVPLRLLRAMGWVLGAALLVAVRSRRRVVMANLAVCFPELSHDQRRDLAWQTFIHFAQAWLDRSWLWHAPADVVRQETPNHSLPWSFLRRTLWAWMRHGRP